MYFDVWECVCVCVVAARDYVCAYVSVCERVCMCVFGCMGVYVCAYVHTCICECILCVCSV